LIRNYSSEEIDIEKMEFNGFIAEIDASSKKIISAGRSSVMIMKEIFEKRGYKLSKSSLLFGVNDKS
jgi:hypothetical protein